MEPTLTPKLAPYLVVPDATALGRFLERSVDGQTTYVQKAPDGRVVHMEVRIADGLVMVGEAPAGRSSFPAMVHLYVPDPDATYRAAISAGAKDVQPVALAPDGQRRGGVKDPWGNEWWFSGLPK
jgi:PhnB protein